MPRYTQEVVEIRTVRCLYVVEAETIDEAKEMFEAGETIREIELPNTVEVQSRLPQGEPEVAPKAAQEPDDSPSP